MRTVAIKGRVVEIATYYPCPWCGLDDRPSLIMWDAYVNMTPEGALVFSLVNWQKPPEQYLAERGIVLIKEVGRTPCAGRRDTYHVYYDWRWAGNNGSII